MAIRELWAGTVLGAVVLWASMTAAQPAPADAPEGCAWAPPPTSAAGGLKLQCRDAAGAMTDIRLPEGFDRQTMAKAERGDPAAMLALSLFYFKGPANLRDPQLSIQLIERASAAGLPGARRELGVIHLRGFNGRRDPQRGMALLIEAANLGDVKAMYLVAEEYREGRNVARDPATAARWFKVASEAGDTGAMNQYYIALQEGDGVPRDQAEALRWLGRAAEAGNATAMLNLGSHYSSGRDLERNDEEAVRWWRKGLEAGDKRALRSLAWAYANGRGVAKDRGEAERLVAEAETFELEQRTFRRWDTRPSENETWATYPIRALIHGVSGRAKVFCTVGLDRRPANCAVMDETPGGWGFGAGALKLVSLFRLKEGLDTDDNIIIPIVYSAEGFRVPTGPVVDLCAAYAFALAETGRKDRLDVGVDRFWLELSRQNAGDANEAAQAARLASRTAETARIIREGKDVGFWNPYNACRNLV